MRFVLMNKNIEVATILITSNFEKASIEEIFDIDYIPFHIQASNSPDETFDHWLQHRCIPSTRDGIVNFMESTSCQNVFELSVKNRMLSLSDHYWLKKKNEDITWEDVNFFTNNYSDNVGNIIVGTEYGQITDYKSPDLTTNGWLKKAWRRDKDGKDYLFKLGSAPYFQEPINEVFCSELLAKFSNIDYVPYILGSIKGNYCSICPNFVTETEEFIPAFQIYRTAEKPFYIEPYKFLIDRCLFFGIKGVRHFIDVMIAFDYLIGNTDRHMGNFGFMRNVDTKEFTRIAPLFDNGTSLWNDAITNIKINDKEELFRNWQEGQIKLIRNWDGINMHEVMNMSDLLHDMLLDSGANAKQIDKVCKKYDFRWNELNQLIEKSIEKKKHKYIEVETELCL